ncbi:unnamed protein product [Brassicogethes aeneus]|uniref:Uncharacterized protein n=1 Tax=Brassicogethes aeneus TaxID=1431903 RepID=A0A9P0B8R2_BRAAE|nr:unnamed protein product [Brassicogethes aeneus]
MDGTKEKIGNKNPRDTANSLSVLFFTYTFKFFKRGYGKTIFADDIFSPITCDKSQELGDRLEKKWITHITQAKKLNKTPKFSKTLIATFWMELLSISLVLFIQEVVFKISQAVMLGNLLDFFQPQSTMSKNEALLYATAMVILNLAMVFANNQYLMNSFHYGARLRAAICALVYRKALRLSKTALGDTASGKIVNLISSDVSRFEYVTVLIHQMWVAPTSAAIGLYIMYSKCGYPIFIGIIPFFLILVLQSYIGRLSAKFRKQTATKIDERLRLMNEIVSGVQVIKMYAWERPFSKLINFARRAELKKVTKSSYVRAIYMAFGLFTTRVALFGTLVTMAIVDESITPGKIFVVVALLNNINFSMCNMFVRGVSEVSEALVSLKRIQGFLLKEECNIHKNTPQQNVVGDKNDIVKLIKATVKWEANEVALDNLDLTVKKGSLVGIIGPVGSGKSTLLQTLLGELELSQGSISVNGTISYASQEAWIFGASLRQNILFGNPYDRQKYNQVVRACALEEDFKQFEDGDLSLVGDRGSSLSGGQKARISLARCVYRDADVYLLDDPLSAVDVQVAKHLYKKCINGLLKDKTRVLVTHQVHHLKNCEHILIFNEGKIVEEGSYSVLSNSGNIYAKLLNSDPDKDEESHGRNPKRLSRLSSISSVASEDLGEKCMVDFHDEIKTERKHKDLQEETSKGKVKGSLLWKYLSYGGGIFYTTIVLALFLTSQTLASSVDYFVNFWVNLEENRNKTIQDGVSIEPTLWSKIYCIEIYTILIISLFIMAFVRSFVFYNLAMKSSKNLHTSLFNNVITATMRFFDTNASGRILNRFSKDLCSIDEFLPKNILDAAQILLQMVGTFVLVTIVNQYFFIMIFIISILLLIMRYHFLKSSKNIKRLEGIMKSPIFTHLNTTLQGLTTIRAFNAENILKSEFDKHQDYHTGAYFMYLSCTAAFGFYLDIMCYFLVVIVTYSFLTFGEDFGMTGAKVGLAITQAMSLTHNVQWGTRQSAEVANMLVSVERIVEYDVIPKEPQPVVPKKLDKTWPNEGHIVFKDVRLKYDDEGDWVLKGLNFEIKPKEKVGIVGRTGAGKSSLISALFRMANVDGEIIIDEVDTKTINLQDLRSKISIIPQDPVLFSGTLRYNLDPFEEYPDDLLYKAINEVELKDPDNIINRLENNVQDGGANYSVGQRQLICLARAIVRNNKILMLDEATANVDPQTDSLIQKTIRKKFADCTVVTVAHRLNTIMDSDKVLVMEFGSLAEFDHPHVLLQNQGGIFNKMVSEMGETMSDHLRKIAYTSYQKHSSS